jgi:ferrous iron transport protein B
MKQQEIVIALAGNPNCGKTSVFNNLTGARQHVGNWPGVTVEKKEGTLTFKGQTIRVVDLPGAYSLGAYTEDEAVARDYILFEKPDVVINIVDSTNLTRNLYLTTQLLEMGAKVIVALNMCDELAQKGMEINSSLLSQLLGVPVVATVASQNKGMDELIAKAVSATSTPQRRLVIDYGKELEAELQTLAKKISNIDTQADSYGLAVKILEGDEAQLLGQLPSELPVLRDEAVARLAKTSGDDLESVFADRRYDFINKIVEKVVMQDKKAQEQLSTSDRIDRIVTNRFLGIPIFLLVMWGIFQFTFKLGDPLVELIELLFERFGILVETWLGGASVPQLLVSFISDGVIGGLGSILVFIPHIFLIFLAISILEDSGYMARAAYIMDRFMHLFGLHGKSFLPLLIGFGCNVPGIMATRTLESKRDRIITILINPLMSCSARLPIYILFTSALFSANRGLVIFSLYLLGMVLAVLMGMLFQKLFFKEESVPLVIELPPYRIPTFRGIFIQLWERVGSFLQRAGTIIFAAVILIWVLANLPLGVAYASQDSLIGKIGMMLSPLLKPAGFGTWQAATALLFGIIAKEIVVSTLGVLHGVGDEGLAEVIAKNWTPLSAYSFMVMNLLYIPCVATIGAIRRETNSWRWTLFAVGYSLLLGWIMATLIYQLGRLLGFA